MSSNIFCKSLIAISIATAISTAHAEKITLNNDGLHIDQKQYSNDVTINGSYNKQSDYPAIIIEESEFASTLHLKAKINSESDGDEFPAIYINDIQVKKLINDGNVSAISDYGDAFGVDIYNTDIDQFINNSNITAKSYDDNAYALSFYSVNIGKFSNTGNITTNADDDADAFTIYDATIGSFVNSGNIISNADDDADALEIEDSIIESFTNSGKIIANADDEADTLSIYNSYINEILNKGDILALGYDSADALEIDDSHIVNFINTGNISATSNTDYATGIEIYDSEIESFRNDGKIEAITNNSNDYDEDYDADSYALYIEAYDRETSIGSLINNGTITATSNNSSAYSVYIYGEDYDAHVENLINNGTITANAGTGEDDYAAAITLESYWNDGLASVKDLTNKGIISSNGTYSNAIDVYNSSIGNFNNSGSITSEGYSAIAINAYRSEFDSLNNSGTIRATGQDVNTIRFESSDIFGDFENSGLIEATGSNYPVSGYYDEQSKPSAVSFIGSNSIHGNFINNKGAEISAYGFNATAVNLSGVNLGGSFYDEEPEDYISTNGAFINNGTIKAVGTNANAVTSYDDTRYHSRAMYSASLSNIINTGTISAEGTDSTALRLDEMTFTGTGYQLENSGNIQSSNTAIYIGNTYTNDDVLNIKNSGNISGDYFAIDASNNENNYVNLDWDAGTINGNLTGLNNINVLGTVAFNASTLTDYSYSIDMYSDGETNGAINVGNFDEGIAGHLEFGQEYTDIYGDLYVAGNSSLGMTPTLENNWEMVYVNGDAYFADGSQIKLKAQANDFAPEGSSYDVLYAENLINDGVTVSSTSLLLNAETNTDDNLIWSTVSAKSESEAKDVILEAGGSRNAAQAGAAFLSVASQLAADTPDDEFFQAYINASENQATLAQLSEQMSPDASGAATHAATAGQSLITAATSSRTSNIRGASSGDILADTGLWIQALQNDAEQGVRDGVAGFDAKSNGFAIGADGKLNDQLTLGFAYSFIDTDVKSDNGNSTEVDGHNFTLYGGLQEGNYFVDANLTYGANDNEGKRRVAGTTAKASYDSTVLAASVIAGYSHAVNQKFVVEPRIAARYANIDIDGYKEKGSSAALDVDGERYSVAEVGAGVRLAGNFEVAKGSLQPQVTLMGYHDFVADQVESTSSFVMGGSSFTTTGAKPARNSYEVGVGVDYLSGPLTTSVGYNVTSKSDFDSDAWSLKVRYDF